jgi:hypothetical protein
MGTDSKVWDWGLGFDLWSGLNPIVNFKYQWLPPVEDDDFCAAMDVEFTAPYYFSSFGASTSVFGTLPLNRAIDFTFGSRYGAYKSRIPFSPASAGQDSQVGWGPFYPQMGSFQYIDVFTGLNFRVQRPGKSVGEMFLGCTARIPFLEKNRDYVEYNSYGRSVYNHEDYYYPMLAINLGFLY